MPAKALWGLYPRHTHTYEADIALVRLSPVDAQICTLLSPLRRHGPEHRRSGAHRAAQSTPAPRGELGGGSRAPEDENKEKMAGGMLVGCILSRIHSVVQEKGVAFLHLLVAGRLFLLMCMEMLRACNFYFFTLVFARAVV